MFVTMLVVQGRPKGKFLTFPPGEYLFGRGDECHVRPVSPWVSRQHCLLTIGNSEVKVTDLASSNGTLVNGSRVLNEAFLRENDFLQVGPLALKVIKIGSPGEHPPVPTSELAETADADEDSSDSNHKLAELK